MSGQLQFSGAGAESAVAARVEGGDIVLLACPVDSDPVYFIARPEIKSAAELKGKSTAVTRLGSTTHFYLRAAARYVGLDADKDMTILQLGTGTETVSALESGRIAAAAVTHRYALPFLQKGWPLLIDLSTTDLVYPSSCVASSRAFVKSEPKLVEDFLRAYVQALQRIKKDPAFAEKTFAKWLREKDPVLIKKTVEAYNKVFKLVPSVPDKGIENVLKDLANRRPVSKEFIGKPELFRDNIPLEKALSRS
jgi:ABC-type nitrate/sulfonate/bicarbonate transport system substrate-binding protein